MFSVVIGACVAACGVGVAGPVPGPEMLPSKTYALVTVPSVATLKDRMLESSFGDLIADEEFEAFIADCRERYEAEVADKITDVVGLSAEEILDIATGEFTVAFAEIDDRKLGLAGILDYEDDADLDVLIGKIEDLLEERDAERTTADIDGTEVVLHELAGTATDVIGKLAYFKKDDRFVFGNERMIEAILARWDGGNSDSLASAEIFSYVMEKTKTDDRTPAFAWYIDPIALVELGIRANQRTIPQAQMALGFFPILGLKNLRAIGAASDIATDEFESVSKGVIYVEQPSSGLLGLFEFPATRQNISDWVPADAVGYSVMNWDVASAYGAVSDLFNMLQGPGMLENQIDRIADSPNGPGVHIKDDVIDGLTGTIEVVSFPSSTEVDDDTLNPAALQQEIVVAAELTDPQRVEELMAEFADSDAYTGRVRTFEGTSVYEIPNPSAAQGGPENIAFAVIGSKFFASFGTSHVEDAIRGVDVADRLSESPAFNAIADRLPAQTSIMGYQSSGAQLEAVYGFLKSEAFANQLGGFDLFESLPSFEAIEKYLTNAGSYVVPDANGAFFVNFAVPAAD
ncbi:MAG: hypothetical protein AAF532_17135 [Planctomycetota bacterium]